MKTYQNPRSSELKEILKRPEIDTSILKQLVEDVFTSVKREGDEAVKRYTSLFDKVKIDQFLVSEVEIEEAKNLISESLKDAISVAKANIEKFHQAQFIQEEKIETMPGVVCWRKSVGIEKVGLYIPGGSAPLFSTILMLGIPAKIAGCREIILCTPANAEGKINPAILYTASLLGITSIFKVGGIQAIAAMSLGTESIPSVYKIFGPGNQYVTAAKQYAQQKGIAIDMPAGPSEVMVVADEDANPQFIAADLLSQAEHGADSQVVLVSNSMDLMEAVKSAIDEQVAKLPRMQTAQKSLQNAVFLEVEKSRFAEIINEYAPEHLILNTNFNNEILPKIVNAGSVFIGPYTPESAGDYASGTNHTLPTNGFARAYSGVSVDSFVKKITFQEISKVGIEKLGPFIETLAQAEELEAHKNAVTIRLRVEFPPQEGDKGGGLF